MNKTRFSISNDAPEIPMIRVGEKKLETAEMDCPMCGGKMIVTVSSSTVGKMRDSSTVGKMRERSTAKDFKNYPNIKIHIPKGGKFEMVEHEEEKKCD